MADPCLSCKGTLAVARDGKSGVCSNTACPGGRNFYHCGYCRKISFSLAADRMKCYNPACRTYNISRSRCPTCDKISVVPHDERPLCINRDCPDHASVIAECFFCTKRLGRSMKSFLTIEDVMFCTKGDCEYLFRRVELCDICGQLSYVADQQTCRNEACEIAGTAVDRCPTCRLKTLASDAKGARRCLNPKCKYRSTTRQPAVPKEDPTEQYDVTLVAPPKQEAPAPVAAPAPPEPVTSRRVIENIFDTPIGDEPPQASAQPPEPPPTPPPPPPSRKLRGLGQPSSTPPVEPSPFAPPPRRGEPPPPLVPPAPPQRDSDGAGRAPPSPTPARPFLRAGASAIEEAYDFLRGTFMEGKGAVNPLTLIIGLSGSGKSTYLTMLGDILRMRDQRYFWGCPGVEAEWVKVDELLAAHGGADPKRLQRMRARVRDLVTDFSKELHEKYIAKQHWPPATARDAEGDELNPATYFLVTDIQRDKKSLANVITVETSGEEYQELLRNFQRHALGEDPKNPVQRVLLDLMNIAEGFIVLIDPDNRDNDAIFTNFFMVLKEGLRPRALNVFYREVGAGVGMTHQGKIDPGKITDVGRLLKILQEDDLRRRRFEDQLSQEKKLAMDRLLQIKAKLEAGRDEILAGDDGTWLKGLEKILEGLEPDLIKRVRENLIPPGASSTQMKDQILLYYKGLTRICADLIDRVMRKKLESSRPAADRSAILEIKKKYDLSETFKVEIDEKSFVERPVARFKNLKHIAIVVTKSDKYPIIYPPENYPRQKLPGCELYLRDIQDYLKLCGGQVRYYNASVPGYAILSAGAHIPGPMNTHTPINVLEPLFDMLGISS